MSPFKLIRINPRKTDLSTELFDFYVRIDAYVRSCGKAHILREGVIVSLLQQYPDPEKVELCIQRACARPIKSLDHVVDMIEGLRPLEWIPPAPKVKVNERPVDHSGRSGSGGPRSATDFLADHPAKITKPPIKGRIPEGLMTIAQVNEWLMTNNIAITRADEFFTFAGVGTNGANYWTLLPEHLRPKHESEN